jgi:signal transduction histidine kinase
MDLREAVISVIDTVSSNYPNVIVNSTIEVNKAKIQGDNYLPILLTNITENAFSQSKNSERHVWITLKDSLDGFQFIVEDDGPGIADDRKESLFDPNRRFGGVGIHQSMKIVEKYGGTIGVSDRIDGDYTQGAKFKIYIPRAD